MRRVLWLTKGLGPGGAERLLVTHAAHRARDEFQCEAAYVLPWKDHLVAELEALGVTTHCLGGGRDWDLRWAERLRHLLSTEPFDILHSHSPYPAAIARMVVRTLPRNRRPVLLSTEHNRWQSHTAVTRLANALTFRMDAAHVAVSQEVRSSIRPRLQADVEVIRHGVDLAHLNSNHHSYAEARRELGIGDDQVLVGTVANLRATKAYPDLLAAARIVAQRCDNVQFVAAGQGPLAAELEQLRDELDLAGRFEFLGYRPDAPRLLAGCDVFVLASHHEGLPIALLEAMALGVPVVATNVGGIPEVVTDGVEALLVPAGEPQRLAGALESLIGNAQLRRTLGAAAATRAEAFDGRVAVQRMEAIYRSV